MRRGGSIGGEGPRRIWFDGFVWVLLVGMLLTWNTWAEEPRGYKALEARVKGPLLEALGKRDFSKPSLVTILEGWDFDHKEWRLNEVANQTVHLAIGGFISRLWDRQMTLCVAVGIELEQFLINDAYDLKLADRVRDVSFYLLG